jgi:hypothetical protein
MQIVSNRITIAIVIVAFIIAFILSQIALIYSGREGVYQW